MASPFLRFLDLLQPLYRAMGVHYPQLRAIVGVKLMMDNRRQSVTNQRKSNDTTNSSFWVTLFFHALFGAFVAMVIYNLPSFALAMMVFFGYVMVMLTMTLITDFSSILLDTSDNTIILPRPVDSRTLFAARTTHISLYLIQITIGLSLFPAVAVWMKVGGAMLGWFLLAVVFAVVTALFLTHALYLMILRFSNEERLKNIINYFQIAMAVLIMGGYQLLPRVSSQLELQDFVYEVEWWNVLLPPVWIAGALDMIYSHAYDAGHMLMAALAVVVPLAGFYFVNQHLTPMFTRKLGVMDVEQRQPQRAAKSTTIGFRLGNAVTNAGTERAAFEIVFFLLGRDRKLKLKIYPVFGYMFIFALIFIFRSEDNWASSWQNLPDSKYHLLLLYLTFMVLQVAFYEIPYSDDYKASWVYYAAPLQRPGLVLVGMLKAIIVRLFLPAYLVIALIVGVIWKTAALDDIVFAFLNNLLMLLTIATIGKRSLPLSQAPNAKNQSGTFVRSLILLVLLMIIGFGHYWLSDRPLYVLAGIPIQLVIGFTLYRLYRNTSWRAISV